MKRPAPQAPAGSSWLPSAVVALTFLAFLPALSNRFVDWDDGAFIVRNPHIRGLWPANVLWAFTSRMAGQYHPLTWLSLMLDYAVWGLSPTGFHLTNILLHALNAGLFFYLAKRLFALAQPELAPKRAAFAAALAALLFGLHPLRVESAAWATERRDVLSGFFYLLAALEYLKERRSRSLAYFALSLLAKGVGVTLPAALLVLDWFPLRRLEGRWRERLVEKWPYFALAGAALAANAFTESFNGALQTTARYGVPARLASAAYGLCFYLSKSVWPARLIPIYEFPPKLDPFEPRFVLCAGLAAGLTLAAVFLRKKRPALLASWLFYGLTLSPMLGLARFGPQLVADRYSYLSCLPLALLAAAGAEWLARRAHAELVALCAVVLAGLAALTWRQCAVWHDTDGFFAYVLAQAPDTAIAHHNVGRRLEAQGRMDEALAQYRAALAINPDYPLALNSLGLALARTGHPDQAEAPLRKALSLEPDYWEARANLGLALAAEGRYADAQDALQAAIALQPQRESLRRNLALVERAAAGATAQARRR